MHHHPYKIEIFENGKLLLVAMTESNADVYLNAPDLLEALEELMKEMWDEMHSSISEKQFNILMEKQIKAIAKAKGQT